MKTKAAFALRGFDSERILQRKFFLHWLGFAHEDTDSNAIDIYNAAANSHRGSAEMVKLLSYLQKLKVAVSAYKKMLDVHIKRLETLRNVYTEKFAETAAQIWQEKYRRAKDLQQTYSGAIDNLRILQAKIGKLEQDGEKAIDKQRRKEFAERLQDARQQAGLKQSEVAAQVKIASTTLANYEQGRSDPSIPMLIRIAQALNISTDKLLGLT